jgi:hypothetical protein
MADGVVPTYTPREGLDVGSSFGLPDLSNAFGQALGMAADAVGAIAQKRQQRQEELDRFQAEQGRIAWQLGNGQTLENAGQNLQPGARGLHDGVMTDAEARRQAYLATVPTYLRDEYDLKTQASAAELSLSAAHSENENRDIWFRNELSKSADQLLPIIRQQGLAGLETFTQQQIDAINASSLSPAEKEQEVYKWRALAQLAVAEGMTPEALIELIDPSVHFASALVERESGGRPTVVNDFGYAGLYQFGAPRLQELGLYRPGAAENLDTWSETSVDETGKWSGTFNIPGYPNVRTLTDFLSNPAAQRAAYNVHMGQISEQITARGLDRYIGQTIKGVLVTREGIAAMAHLGGMGGAERFLTSNGEYDPGDSNETKLSSYLAMGSRAMSAGPLDALPYNVRMDLVADARSAIVARDNAMNAAAQEQHDIDFNALLTAIHDGQAGYAEISAARDEGWLTDFDEIKKAEGAVETYQGQVLATSEAISKLQNPDYAFNPFSEDDKDAVDLAYTAQGGSTDLLGGATHDAAVARVAAYANRTGIIPSAALTELRGGMWSSNQATRATAFSILDGLTRANPRLLNDLTESDRSRLMDWQALAGVGLTDEELAKRFDTLTDPANAQRQKTLREQGLELARDEYSIDKILTEFDPSGWMPLGDRPSAPPDAYQQARLLSDFQTLFAERYSISGNKDVAYQQAIDSLHLKWGISDLNLAPVSINLNTTDPTRVTPTPVLMAYPPNSQYPEVNGTHDWMKRDLAEMAAARYPGFQSVYVVSTRATEAALGSGAAPYDVMIVDANGVLRRVENQVFDYEKYRSEAEAEFQALRAAVEERGGAATVPPPLSGASVGAAIGQGILSPPQVSPPPASVTPGGAVTPAPPAPTVPLDVTSDPMRAVIPQ